MNVINILRIFYDIICLFYFIICVKIVISIFLNKNFSMLDSNHHLPQTESNSNIILILVKKELQDAKLINELIKLGFSSSQFGPCLGEVILKLLGVENRNDEWWEWYYQMLDKFAEKVELTNESGLVDVADEFIAVLRSRVDEGS